MRNKCPICGENGTALFLKDFEAIKTIVPFKKYSVTKCNRCGMIYASDIIESMKLEDYYSMVSKYDNSLYGSDEIYDEFYSKVEKEVSSYNDKNVSLLDIGSGNGAFLKLLKSRGYKNLTGLEPSSKSCKYIEEHDGIHMVNGIVGKEIPELKGKRFQCIVLTGVLEHIMPVREMLSISLEYLDDYGTLFIAVPNVESFYEYPDLYQQFSCEHINFFSYRSLDNLMKSLRMKIVDSWKYRDVIGIICAREKNIKKDCLDYITFDDYGEKAICKYLSKAEDVARDIKGKLAPYIGNDIYIWGAGTHTCMLYQLGLLDGIRIAGIIDSNANYIGKTILGTTIFSPTDNIKDYPILISSQYAQESIDENIHELGLNNLTIKLY